MRLAYVVSFAFPNASAGTRRVIGICQALAHAGVKVTIYSSAESVTPCQSTSGLPENVKIIFSGDRSLRKPLKQSLSSKLLFGRKVFKILKQARDDFDAILLYSGYTPMLLRLLVFGYKYKKRVYFDAVEWASSGTKWWHSLYFLNIEFAMRYLVPKCTGVICISSFLENYYISRTKVLRVPAVFSIPGFRLNNPLPKNCSNSNPIKILYLGNSDHDQVDLLCKFFHSRKKELDGIQLHIAGNFKDKRLVEKMYSDCGIYSKIILHGQLSQGHALNLLRTCHFMIFLRKDNHVTRAGFPTKFVQSISNSVPVITNSSSDLEPYLLDNQNCIKVAKVDERNVYQALNRVLTMSPDQYEMMSHRAHQCAVGSFDPSIYSKKILCFLKGG